MTASSEEDNYPAHSGRLNEAASAWCPKISALQDPVLAKSQYLQIDLITLKRIHGITIQGLEPKSVVKMYQVYYAVDPGSFRIFRNKQTHEVFVSIPLQGVFLGILSGGMPPGSPNPRPISDQKLSFPHPFSGLASS